MRNRKSVVVIVAFALLLLVGVVIAVTLIPDQWSLTYSYRGKQIHYSVTREEISLTPAWDIDSATPPTLTYHAAVTVARRGVRELDVGATDCAVSIVSLERFGSGDHWLYVVSFNCDGGTIRVPVLLDGECARPVIKG